MRCADLIRVWILCLVTILICSPALAEKKSGASKKTEPAPAEQAERFFDMKVPEGFTSEPVEESGILKWKKGSAEIYLVVGNLFAPPGESLFKALRKAAGADKSLEEVRTLQIKGGKALLYKQKAPDDPSRLRVWHLVVITKKKMIDVDFSAPAKDFKSFIPAFESAINSFKLKSPS
ncbi:MAG: hypothetical protein WBG50_26310 [Desulfomonilaceae bacterium]